MSAGNQIVGGSVDLLESAADVAPVGTTRLARKGGALLASTDGAAFAALGGGGGLDSLARQNMQRYLTPGKTPTWAWWRQLDGISLDLSQSNTGTGTTGTNIAIPDTLDQINGLGGGRRVTTSVATDGAARMAIPDFSVLVPTIAYNDNTKKFYRMHRARLITAPTTDTILRLGSFNWASGVHGGGSTTKYTCRINTSGTYLVSTVSIDTSFHIFEHWYDGNGAWFSVDGEEPIGVFATGVWPLNTGQSFGEMSIVKVGGAVDHQADISFGFWGGTLP